MDLLDCSDSLAVYLGDFLEKKELYGYLWTQTLQVGDFERCYKSCRKCALQTDDLMLKKVIIKYTMFSSYVTLLKPDVLVLLIYGKVVCSYDWPSPYVR